MSIKKLLFFGAILVYASFETIHASKAEYDAEEQRLCTNSEHSFATVIDGERRVIPFDIIDGQVVVEGDVVIETLPIDRRGYVPPVVRPSVNGSLTYWPRAADGSVYIVPFTVDENLIREAKQQSRLLKDGLPDYIHDAIAAWERDTLVRFRPIADPKDWRRDDYLKFMDAKQNYCSSNSIGVREKGNGAGEENNVNVIKLPPGFCRQWGAVAHEIGHALGLFHEQTRDDRDNYVKIMWKNIRDDPTRRQYCKALYRGGVTLQNTNYDYDSIMHYSITAGAVPDNAPCPLPTSGNRACLTMVPLRLNEQAWNNVGRLDHLSAGDIRAVNDIYRYAPPQTQQSCVTISTTTKVTDRNGTTTNSTTTSVSGNCAVDVRTRTSGKSHEHKGGCPVTCCWSPARRCCEPGWCPPRRYESGAWYPPPPPWAYRFWSRDDFDD